jgi:hypothetical protein
MNSKQRKTLDAVFSEPVNANIAWSDIESLLLAMGCTVREGSGSRVRFVFGHAILAVHRPHPRKEAKQYLVREVRDFLKEIGVIP